GITPTGFLRQVVATVSNQQMAWYFSTKLERMEFARGCHTGRLFFSTIRCLSGQIVVDVYWLWPSVIVSGDSNHILLRAVFVGIIIIIIIFVVLVDIILWTFCVATVASHLIIFFGFG
ncbi:hypothetical protein, partial [Salinibaculum salinum]|uniref:hypothetical protein n=1 Tax=Salinibaculum salinum TaxID=3131996 RepID=UPI0030EC474A